ncbi:AMP-binding protein, partial [Rhodococcus sp. T7]|uniref:AMP-binding protein n=1 Tax=Rhodococcus sp. T7 TaxID=627444 RepID=UPI001F249181
MLPQLLTSAVEAQPSATALVYDGQTLTYNELDERSSRMARALIDRGVGPEDVVAIALTRSIDSVLAVWAVAKSGAAFVPVDPNYPPDRITHMVTDSAAVIGLTTAARRDALPDVVEWKAIDDADFIRHVDSHSSEGITYMDRVRLLRAEHPAYVIYTSGSTGKPKGVVVTHAGLAGLVS